MSAKDLTEIPVTTFVQVRAEGGYWLVERWPAEGAVVVPETAATIGTDGDRCYRWSELGHVVDNTCLACLAGICTQDVQVWERTRTVMIVHGGPPLPFAVVGVPVIGQG